ncbi:MAG: cell division protein ZapA [Chitinispirillales bacterium]|jgi:cell division protein ZapA (FtsZ GTPase activity inhibitor)|nr:cell division protein ZapA [Chitinispirillales bacterium]
MLEQKLKIDGKEYIIRSANWDREILIDAAAQLEEGILYYKKSKDEISAVVLAALAFAYDSTAKSKSENSNQNDSSGYSFECEQNLRNILQKINKHIQTPQKAI